MLVLHFGFENSQTTCATFIIFHLITDNEPAIMPMHGKVGQSFEVPLLKCN
jgi:hypothetical protein